MSLLPHMNRLLLCMPGWPWSGNFFRVLTKHIHHTTTFILDLATDTRDPDLTTLSQYTYHPRRTVVDPDRNEKASVLLLLKARKITREITYLLL